MGYDWMAHSIDGLIEQGKLIKENIEKAPAHYNVPAPIWNCFTAALSAAEASRELTKNPATRTTVLVAKHREDHDALMASLRDVHDASLRKLSVEEQKRFGFKKVSNGTRTSSKRPKDRAGIKVLPTKNRYQYRVFALNRNNTVKPGVRPDDAGGTCFASLVTEAGAPAPIDPEDMPGKEYYAGTDMTFTYKASDMGKMVYYAVCYTSRTNKRGPWSEIVGVLIT